MKHLNLSLFLLTAVAAIAFCVNSCKKVEPAEPATVNVSSVSVSPSSLTMKEGDKTQLSASVSPSDATDKALFWSSSSASVASVDNNGNVTAGKAGTATITAKAGGKTGSCSVTVTSSVIDVTLISLNKSELSLTEGGSETLTATVKPDDATDKAVTWTSDKESIATVKDGKVTAAAEGSATITAKAGSKSATCKVTVSAKVIAVTSITLNKSDMSLTAGDNETLTATVKPDDATDKAVTWTSDKESVATVKDGKVTAVAMGSATITAKAGSKSATCEVTVSEKVIPATGISVSPSSLEMMVGQTRKLTATLTPTNTTQTSLVWSQLPRSFETDGKGTYTAKAMDYDDISTSSSISVHPLQNYKIEASCKFTVYNINFLNTKTMTIVLKGETTVGNDLVYAFGGMDLQNNTYVLDESVIPSDGFSVKSSSPSVATVEKVTVAGKKSGFGVTPVSAGKTTITVTIGSVSKTLEITVSEKVVAATGISLSPSSVELMEGMKTTIKATLSPSNTTQTALNWEDNTRLKHIGGGEYEAQAITQSGVASTTSTFNVSVKDNASVSATFKYTVNKIRFTSLLTLKTVTAEEVELGGVIKPSYYFTKGADNSGDLFPTSVFSKNDYTVTSSNKSVATVEKCENSGFCGFVVNPVAVGSTTISVKCGSVTRTLAITVIKKVVPATSITVTPNYVTAIEGKSFQVKGTLTPVNSTYTINWNNISSSIMYTYGNGKYSVKKLNEKAVRYSRVGVFTNEDKSITSYFDYAFYRMRFCLAPSYQTYDDGGNLTLSKVSQYLYFRKGEEKTVLGLDIIGPADFTVTSNSSCVNVQKAIDNNSDAACIHITPIDEGVATITVTIGEVSRSFTVTVQ